MFCTSIENCWYLFYQWEYLFAAALVCDGINVCNMLRINDLQAMSKKWAESEKL
jgi:hypothetical protein